MPKKAKSKKKTTITIVTICCAILSITLLLIFISAVRPQKILTVGSVKAELGPLDDIVSASGMLKATNSAVMASQTIGRVKKALVKPGEKVALGQTIILIDDVDARLALSNAEIAIEETRRNILNQLAELRASLRRAETSRAQALRSFANAKELKTVDGISAEDWRQASEGAEQAESDAAGAKDALRLAQGLAPSEEPVMDSSRDQEFLTRSPTYKRASISLENARRALSACTILAEASGTVVEVSVDTGSYVQGGSALAKIEDLSAVTAEVNVDEVDIGKIKTGQSASISADSLFGRELKGTVSAIRPVVKSTGSGRICVVVIDVDLEKEKALSGATCVARVNSRIKEEALVIPASALIPGAAPPAVWLLAEPGDAGKKNPKRAKSASGLSATRREVKLGASTASKIEIVSGLAPGDIVAVDGIKGLAEGTLVKNRAEEK